MESGVAKGTGMKSPLPSPAPLLSLSRPASLLPPSPSITYNFRSCCTRNATGNTADSSPGLVSGSDSYLGWGGYIRERERNREGRKWKRRDGSCDHSQRLILKRILGRGLRWQFFLSLSSLLFFSFLFFSFRFFSFFLSFARSGGAQRLLYS